MKLLLQGIPASPGIAEGRAQLFSPGDDTSAFNESGILVTKITDPTMVRAMIKAAAIVCDIGGITSHPAILSREMGIPCIVNTQRATALIKNGVKLKVDGSEGKIYVVD
jgi:pyruvate,water dikinase